MGSFVYGAPTDNFGIERQGVDAIPATIGDLVRYCVAQPSSAMCQSAWQRYDAGPLENGIGWTLLAAMALGGGFAALRTSRPYQAEASPMNHRPHKAAFAPKMIFGVVIFIAAGFALNVFSNDYGHFRLHPSPLLTILGLASLSAFGAGAIVWAIQASGGYPARPDKPDSRT